MSAPLIGCRECDLLQRLPALEIGESAHCQRCGVTLAHRLAEALDRPLALALTALLLFVIGNLFPLVALEVQGREYTTSLLGAVTTLWEQDRRTVATVVFLTTMLLPALEFCGLIAVLLPLHLGRHPPYAIQLLRLIHAARPWMMIEVFMLGLLVSLAKLGHLATVVPGAALFSLALLILVSALLSGSFSLSDLWLRVSRTPVPQVPPP